MDERGGGGENAAPARVGVSRRLRRGDTIPCAEEAEAEDGARDGAPGRGLRGVLGISDQRDSLIFYKNVEKRTRDYPLPLLRS